MDRFEAGRRLAGLLSRFAGRDDVIVLALPRGGVPVAYEVATALQAPLDVFLVRKLGVPRHEELAMGAVATGGVRVLNDEVLRMAGVSPAELDRATLIAQRELERREQAYRGDQPAPRLQGRVAILVDDGLATGATMRAAVHAVRQQGPAQIVVAVPVGAPDTCGELRAIADEVVCALQPANFLAVGLWYAEFEQLSDDEVKELLTRSQEAARG